MTQIDAARLIIEVTAGVSPGHVDAQHSRRYALRARQWESAGGPAEESALLAELNGQAQGYAGLLMLQPDRFNFVNTNWLWL
jgi:hypothetical protein